MTNICTQIWMVTPSKRTKARVVQPEETDNARQHLAKQFSTATNIYTTVKKCSMLCFLCSPCRIKHSIYIERKAGDEFLVFVEKRQLKTKLGITILVKATCKCE
jgi:hypothetical protein